MLPGFAALLFLLIASLVEVVVRVLEIVIPDDDLVALRRIVVVQREYRRRVGVYQPFRVSGLLLIHDGLFVKRSNFIPLLRDLRLRL